MQRYFTLLLSVIVYNWLASSSAFLPHSDTKNLKEKKKECENIS